VKRNKGAVLVLIVVVLTVSATFAMYSYSYLLINSQRDFLFSKYYERAIASALSCREVAMARVNVNFLYRASNAEIANFSCKYSVVTNNEVKDRDVYIDIFATGTVDVTKIVYPKSILVGIKSTVQISHIGPKITQTIIQ
jgi:hypothetical protein